MTPEEFQNNLENVLNKTIEDLEPTMQEAALTAKALLTRRIQAQGFGRKYRSRGYVSLRARRGFETRFVNLTFSGGMFRGWKRPGSIRKGSKITGTVGGIDRSTVNKLIWNKSRYPTFDNVNDEERSVIVDNLVKPRVASLLQKNLFRP